MSNDERRKEGKKGMSGERKGGAREERERELWIQEEKTKTGGTSLVVQWLRLHAPNAGGLGSIPSQGTRFHVLQLRPNAAKY